MKLPKRPVREPIQFANDEALTDYLRYEAHFIVRILAEFAATVQRESLASGERLDVSRISAMSDLLHAIAPVGTDGLCHPTNVVYFSGPSLNTDPISYCWSWLGPLNRYGYATARGVSSIHRALYDTFHPDDPLGDRQGHHRCENKQCIKPWHIEPLTESEHLAQHNTTEWMPR